MSWPELPGTMDQPIGIKCVESSWVAEFIQYSFADGVPRRSIMVAIVVGTILNLINQGDVLIVGGKLNWIKIVLSYIVPYCVATYGAASMQMNRRRG